MVHFGNRKKTKYMSMRQKQASIHHLCQFPPFLTFGLSRLQAPVPRSWASQMVAWPPPSTTGPTSPGVICPSSRPATPMTSAGATGRHPPVSTLGIDGPGGWPGWMEFQVEESEIHVFFFSFFLGVLEFADVLMMFVKFVKENWTKRGSMDGGDAKIYVYI